MIFFFLLINHNEFFTTFPKHYFMLLTHKAQQFTEYTYLNLCISYNIILCIYYTPISATIVL